VRRLKQVLEIVGFEPETNELITNTVYEWEPGGDKFVFKGHSFLFDKIMDLRGFSADEMEQEFQRRVAVIHYLVEHQITDHRQLWNLVTGYYRDPKDTLERIGAHVEAPA
jgi:archaeal flagellar protein FlaI